MKKLFFAFLCFVLAATAANGQYMADQSYADSLIKKKGWLRVVEPEGLLQYGLGLDSRGGSADVTILLNMLNGRFGCLAFKNSLVNADIDVRNNYGNFALLGPGLSYVKEFGRVGIYGESAVSGLSMGYQGPQFTVLNPIIRWEGGIRVRMSRNTNVRRASSIKIYYSGKWGYMGDNLVQKIETHSIGIAFQLENALD